MAEVATITPHVRQLEAPPELRRLQGWLAWRYEQHQGEEKPRKVPFYADGGRRHGKQGSPADRAKLVTFEAAKIAAARRGFDGVGLALLPEWGVSALDFDNCIGPDGAIPEEIAGIISGTYAEHSPSGKGIRAFVKGNLGDHKDLKNPRFPWTMEVFSSSGYVTFTGNPLLSTEVLGLEETVAPASAEVINLCARRFGAQRDNPNDYSTDPLDTFEPVLGLKFNEIEALLSDLDPSMGRDTWIQVGMAVHHETEGEGFDLWDDWSSEGHQYPGTEALQAQWDSFDRREINRRPITMGTVKRMSAEARQLQGLPPRLTEALQTAAEHAKQELTTQTPRTTLETPADYAGKFPIISGGAFSQRPAPKWIIKGVIPDADLGVIFGQSGSGKAQPLDEVVLTPQGWKPMGEIKVGSQVIGSSGLPVSVLAVHPQGLLDEWEVHFSNGTVVRCCAEHLWSVTKSIGGVKHLKTTRELAKKPHHSGWHVPNCAPINYERNPNPLPLDPYLLGALLGDGGVTNYVAFTSADAEIVEEVRKRLPLGHKMLGKSNQPMAYQITSDPGQPNHVWTALRVLGLAGKKSDAKFVPPEYLTAPPADRLLMLQGLMDTDGWAGSSAGTTANFASSARALTEAVREIVMSLGGIANPIRVKKTSGLDSHCVAFRMPWGMNPFLLPRKAERTSQRGIQIAVHVRAAWPTGRKVEMQCITVSAPDSLYVTRDYILTHNSFEILDMGLAIARGIAWRGLRTQQRRVLLIAAEGGGGMAMRLNAYEVHHNVSLGDYPFGVMHSVPNFMVEDDITEILGAIVAAGGLDLIIVDTFAQVTSGANENSGEDMGKALRHARLIREVTGAMVILVHHSGKDTSKGARGWSGIRAATDVELEVVRPEDCDSRLLRTSKQKDGRDDLQWGFDLQQVVVGTDADGDEETSLVSVEAEVPVARAPEEMTPGSVVEQLIVEVLHDSEFGDGAGGLQMEALIDAIAGRLPTADAESVEDAVLKLVERGSVMLEMGLVIIRS